MALDPVVIQFATAGIPETVRAFDSVEQRMVRMERAASQTADRESKVRIKSAKDEAKQRDKAAAETAKAKEKLERQMTRDAESEARRRQSIVRKSSEMAGRYAADLAKQEAREAQGATRAIEREEERKMRIRIRSSEMAGRAAARLAAEEASAQRRSGQMWSQRGRRIGGIVSGSVGSIVSGASSMSAATLGIGGGMLLADSARRELSAERQAALLVNAVTTDGKPPPEATVGNILGQAGALSKTLGVDKETIVSGALEYSRKARGGDIKGALGNMGFFAELSKVTGTDVTDIAAAAGTLQSQNQNLDTGGMRQMLLDVYAQGKAGSLSMVDVAKQLGVMASARGAFAGDVATNQRKLLALGQLAAPEGSPEEAGTFIKDLVMEAGKHRKTTRDTVGLEQMGVKFDKFGRMESPEQMIDAVFRGTKGDITKIEKIFGARGKSLFGALLNPYTSAGGGEAGITAVNKTLQSVTGATMTEAQLHQQNAQIDSTPAEKFHKALNKIEETLSEKLGPRMEKFADGPLPKLMDKFDAIVDEATKFADWFADNPIKGVGAVVLAAITNDLLQAGIGAAAKAAISGLISSAAGGGLSGIAGSATTAGGTVAGASATGAAGALATRAAAGLAGTGAVGMLADIATGTTLKRDAELLQESKNDKRTTGQLISDTFDMKSWGEGLKKVIADAVADPIKFLTTDPTRRANRGEGTASDPARNVPINQRSAQ